jgi:hypothetical protein
VPCCSVCFWFQHTLVLFRVVPGYCCLITNVVVAAAKQNVLSAVVIADATVFRRGGVVAQWVSTLLLQDVCCCCNTTPSNSHGWPAGGSVIHRCIKPRALLRRVSRVDTMFAVSLACWVCCVGCMHPCIQIQTVLCCWSQPHPRCLSMSSFTSNSQFNTTPGVSSSVHV